MDTEVVIRVSKFVGTVITAGAGCQDPASSVAGTHMMGGENRPKQVVFRLLSLLKNKHRRTIEGS